MKTELSQAFTQEADELFTLLETGLVRIEGQSNDPEAVRGLLSTLHNFKGNASVLGFIALESLAHALEELLVPLRGGGEASPSLVSLALEGLDALRRLVPAALAGANALGPDDQRLLERLTRRELAATARRTGGLLESEANAAPSTLRVSLGTLDRMLTLTGELLVARGRLGAMLGDGGEQAHEAAEAFADADRLFADLHDLVLQARLVSIGPLLRRFLRGVRDTALSLDKRVRLELLGADTEIDAALVERLSAPLVHLLRNAIDHGIEAPEVRVSRGKDSCGTVWLSASHQGGAVVLEVKDDGAGLSRERIARRAEELGLSKSATRLSDDELFDFVFRPGFSTRTEVSAVSGRGVGMDVVRQTVEAMRGTVKLSSVEGRGTTVTLRLPLTVAIIEGFSVGVDRHTYVLPMDTVIECLELSAAPSDAEHGVLNLRGAPVPFVRLREALELGGAPPERESVVVVRNGERRAGLVVDALHGQSQTVVKPMGKLLSRLPGVSGTAIEGDGRVSLVLDVPHLLNAAVRRAAELAHAGR